MAGNNKTVQSLIQEALLKDDFDEVVRLGNIAKDLAALEQQANSVAAKKEALLMQLSQCSHEQTESTPIGRMICTDISNQQRGELARKAFLQRLTSSGIELRPQRNKKYATLSGHTIGITYAAELPDYPDQWFMGLKNDLCYSVVFICETTCGAFMDFILPHDVSAHIHSPQYLSISKHQWKYHVIKERGLYQLKLRGGIPINLSEYRDKYENLQ